MIDIKALMESKGLYRTILPTGEELVWRLLTLKEYNKFVKLREAGVFLPLFLYDEVFHYCYVGNPDIINGELPAGYFNSIGQLIMLLSGDDAATDIGTQIDIARSEYPLNAVSEVMKRKILIAFPAYTPEVIDNWTKQEFFAKFTLAEAILVERGNLVVPIVAVDQLGYTPLDTRKIQAKDTPTNSIDFAKENSELEKHTPVKHPSELHPAELERRQRIAKQLDRHKKR